MRKSSALLVFISVACAISALWSFQQLRVERQQFADLYVDTSQGLGCKFHRGIHPAQHTPLDGLSDRHVHDSNDLPSSCER